MTPRPIAFGITELDPGGAERALVEIVSRLPRERWSPHVMCLGPEAPLAEPLRQAGIPVTCLGATSGRDIHVINRLRRELKRLRPALLQTFLFHANVAGRLAGWAAGVPVIVSGLRVAEREQQWHNRLDRWTSSLARHHVAVSQGVAEFAKTQLRLPADRVSVIPNGVDLDAIDAASALDWSELGLPANAQVMLGMGRLHPQKGFDLLIDAVAPLLERHPNWFLVLVGEGAQRSELEGQVSRLGLDGRVLLPGWVPDPLRYLKAAQLFVLSSRWEGMPNVLLQALGCRTPVLATDVEGVVDVLGGLAPECIVPAGSVDKMRQALASVMAGQQPEANVLCQLYQLMVTDFTWSSVANRYSDLYTRLLSGPA